MKEFQTFLVKADEALSRGLKLCIIARGLPGKEKTAIITDIKKYFSKKGKQTVISASDDYMLDLSGKLDSVRL
jgi:signal recognition particle GTPase